MGRISIGGVLGFVAVFAIGLAALANATDFWAGATFILMIGMLFASVLGLFLRGWRNGSWLGFALFGWGYLLLGIVPALGPYAHQRQFSDDASSWIFSKSKLPPVSPPQVLITKARRQVVPEVLDYENAKRQFQHRSANAELIGHWLSTLLFAGVGAVLGVFLAPGRRANDAAPPPA